MSGKLRRKRNDVRAVYNSVLELSRWIKRSSSVILEPERGTQGPAAIRVCRDGRLLLAGSFAVTDNSRYEEVNGVGTEAAQGWYWGG